MKTSLKLWAIAAAVALFTHYVRAEELPKIDWSQEVAPVRGGGGGETEAPAPLLKTKKSSSWWTDFSISPYGAIVHNDLAGKALWGAGLDVGYSINRTVSLHLGNTIYDAPETKTFQGDTLVKSESGWFAGSAIDETEFLFRADLIRGGGQGKDRFVAFLLGSGSRDWNREDWGFGAGGGAELKLSKNFGLGADYRLRAWFDHDKDGIGRGFLSVHF